MKKALLCFAASAFALAAQPAAAATIYNNGGPNDQGGNETTQWVQAQDFTFAANTAVGGAGVYLAGFGGIGAYDGNFQFTIFGNAGGNPGAQLLTGSVTPTISDSGIAWSAGGNAFLFEFDFGTTLNALAGQTYFLGIHASSNFDRDEIYWVLTDPNGTGSGRESINGTYDNWFDNGAEHAFFLTDGVAGAVPEPATWALLILGFGALGGAMRRTKREVRVSFA